MSLDFLLPLGLALLPGIVAYWSGRRLAAKADHPELPDLLLARSGHVNTTFLGSLVAVVLVPAGGMGWIALLLLAYLLGTYPLRRRLYGETWSVGGYLLWWLRSVSGAVGLVLALQFTPLLVVRAYPYHWAAAAAAGAVLTLLALNQTRIWLWTHGATPLTSPDLRARFDEIVRRAGSVVPSVYRIGPRGGAVANAFALPGARNPSVVFGDTLLGLLDGDEAGAVFAHELAHLEQFDARRLRRNRLRAFGAIGSVLAVALVLVSLGSREGVLAMFLGIVLVFAFLWNPASKTQADETAADRRAAELVGDPEAVIRGLTRIHQYSRLPRRWPPEMEAGSTHPSLARRIAALRGEAAAAVPQLATAAVVPSPREGSWLAFDQRRVSFFEGVPAGTEPAPGALHEAAASARSVAYAELADLRLRTAGDAPVLAATDRAGLSWTFPVFPADVETLRSIVHQVDVQLGTVQRAPSTKGHRAFALLALVVAALAGAFGVVLLPALLAVAWPGAVSLAALGTVALGRAALVAADGTLRWGAAPTGWYLAALAAIGIGLLALAVFRAPDRETGPHRPWRVLGPLAVVAGLFLLQVGTATVDWGAGVPAAAAPGVLMLGVGAGMLRLRVARMRRIGGAVAAAGLVPLLLAVGTDRLAGARPDVAWSRAAVSTATSVPLGAEARAAELVQVSPSGRAFLLRASSAFYGDREPGLTYTAGGFGGPRRSFPAAAAALADDGHLLVLETREGVVELRMEPLAGGAPLWRRVLPGVVGPEIAVAGDGGWTVWGHDLSREKAILLSGRGGDGPVRTLRVAGASALATAVPLGGDALLVLRPAKSARGFRVPWPLRAPMADGWELVRADAAGERRLATLRGFPNCSTPDAGGVVCEAVDGRRGTLWSIRPDGSVRRVGAIPPDLDALALRGGTLAAARWTGEVLVIDPAARRGRRIRLPGEEHPRAAYPVQGGVAVLHTNDGGPVLSLFRTSAAP